MKYVRPMIVLLLVALLHGGLLAVALLLNTVEPPQVEPPRIDGRLIQTPPAEIVQAPAPPPPPQPAEPPTPNTRPPKPKPVPKPKPLPPPEKSITLPPEPAVPVPVPAIAPAPVPVPSPVKVEAGETHEAPVTPPRIDASRLNNPAPAYPSISRQWGEEGTVLLELLVLADGRVTDVKIKTSSGYPRLDRSALDAVKRWRYKPAQRDGVAIDYRYLQPITFSLRER